MSQESETSRADVNTGGGAYIGGNMDNKGKFVGRDNIENNINIPPQRDNFQYIALVALVGIILGILAMFFFNSRIPVAPPPNIQIAVPSPTSQATNTLVAPTQTPDATPTYTPSPTVELTATPEPESTMIAPITSAVEIQDAVDQMEIDFCAEGLVYDSVLARQMILQTMAKSEAEKKFFGSQLTSTTAVDSRNPISQTIREDSAGWVRVFGETRYYDGESEDEYCVSFVTYVTEEDRARSVVEK